MQKRVQSAIEKVTEAIRPWKDLEAITYIPSEDDILDPYFFIRFDVYTRGELPDEEQRLQRFHFAGGFETSPFHRKDRFLVDGIPVRVDYKEVSPLPDPDDPDTIVRYLSREEGTYPMFRIAESKVLYAASGWFYDLQESLFSIGEQTWNTLVEYFLRRIEHQLADLGAAVYRDDVIFRKTALAGFIRGLSSALFAINRRFEPSGRGIQRTIYQLADLPEGFESRFQVMLESDAAPERQFKLAEMLTRGTLHLAQAYSIL